MKHTYPWAIELVKAQRVDVHSIVSHHFPLEQSPEAFALNDRYGDAVVKVVIDIT
jgi:threonine dehydrogenase-like Zn-dependent dehydrogenase